jgi:hypothetical protein
MQTIATKVRVNADRTSAPQGGQDSFNIIPA